MLDLLASIDRRTRQIDKWLPKRPPQAASTKGQGRPYANLLEFVPYASPRWVSPNHLAPIAEMFERILRGDVVRAVASTPPRHGKTELLLHGMAYLLADDPERQLSYIGYATTFAEDKSRKARGIAREVGVPISPEAWSRKNWRTGVADGGVWATSITGPLTGQGFGVMIVDDPIRDRATAESATYRQHHYEWFNDTAFTRLEPGGSCIVVQTRWHEDDLAGRLIKDGWECVNLPALGDGTDPDRPEGSALWPERWPAERLLEIKAQLGEYGWASLYQGQPRPRGGALFQDVRFFERLPGGPRRYAIGLDLAYTRRTHADYSVAVVLCEIGGNFYVLDVIREQVEASAFAARLRGLMATYPGVTPTWYAGGTEQGVVSLLSGMGVRVNALPARADKYVRAQPASAAWNEGRILLSEGAAWASNFVAEVASFTGVNDRHDDQVDALAAAFDSLDTSGTPSLSAFDDYQALLPRTRF